MQAAARLSELYVTLRKKYLLEFPDGWRTLDTAKGHPPLSDELLKREHLEGQRSIGVHLTQFSKVLVFDVDVGDPLLAEATTKALLQTLQKYLPPAGIHPWHTGGRGYHVDVHFDQPLPFETLQRFGRLILEHPSPSRRLSDLEFGDIEVFPISPKGRAIRLPLGVHRKTGRRSYFVDHTLAPVPDSVAYLLQIKPIPAALIATAARDYKPTFPDLSPELDRARSELEAWLLTQVGSKDSIEKLASDLYQQGLRRVGTRHKAALLIAVWLKERGVKEAEALEKLLAWTERERKRGLVEHDRRHTDSDTFWIVKWVYANPTYLRQPMLERVRITPSDAEVVLGLKQRSARRVFFELITVAKQYGEKGEFFASYEWLGKRLGDFRANVRRTVKNYLLPAGVLAEVRRGDITPRRQRLATTWRIPHLAEGVVEMEDGVLLCGKATRCHDCAEFVGCRLLREHGIRVLLPQPPDTYKDKPRECIA